MNPDLRRAILWVGIAWGIINLPVGFFAGFTLGNNDSLASVVEFCLIFIPPIIASVAAQWIPMISGCTLLACVIAVLVGFYMDGGMIDVRAVLSTVYLWPSILFGIVFIILAKYPAAPRPHGESGESWEK